MRIAAAAVRFLVARRPLSPTSIPRFTETGDLRQLSPLSAAPMVHCESPGARLTFHVKRCESVKKGVT